MNKPAYRWLPFLIALMTATALGIGGLALHHLESRLIETTGDSLELLATDIAGLLDRVLFERYGDAQMMADAFPDKMRDAAALARYLDRMKERYLLYRWLGVTDARGRIVAATDRASVGTDQSDTAWFQATRDGLGVHLQDVSFSPETGWDRAVEMSAPIRGAGGEFLGTVTVLIGLSELEDVFGRTVSAFQEQRSTAGRIEWQFLTHDGTLVADSLLREEGKVNLKRMGLPSALLSTTAEPGFVGELHPRRQVPVVTGYARTEGYREFPGFHWGVLVRMDRSDILRPIKAVMANVGIVGACLFVPMLGLLLWTTGRLQKEWATSADQLVRLKGLHAVGQAMQQETAGPTEDFALARFLEFLVDTATRITGARYGAFGLFDDSGKQLVQFIPIGVDEATKQAIGSPPAGRGLLGLLAQESGVLRLKDLTQHPAFTGFPPHHPPMRSLLGVPIHAHGRLFGWLYLTEKAGGEEFTDVDEEVMATLAAQAGVAIENGYFLNQIRAAEIQYRTTMAALPLSVVRLDEHDTVRFANRHFCELVRRNETEAIGQPIGTLLPTEDLADLLRSVRADEAPSPRERECRIPGFGLTACRLIARGMRQTGEVILLIEDITALKQAEQDRTGLLRDRLLLLESTGEGIFGIDAEARCTFINKAGAALLGFQPDELIGRNLHSLVHHTRTDGSPYPIEECPIVHACLSGRGCRLDQEVLWRRDGTSFPAEYSAHPILEDGRIRGAVVTFADITGRKRAEQTLRSLVEGTAGAIGDQFFHSLVRQLSVALNVRYALIGEFAGEPPDRVRTIAVWDGSAFLENFEYSVSGLPCEKVLDASQWFYPKEVRARFPRADLLAEMGIESYLGTRLTDAEGHVLGLLVVMHTDPMPDNDLAPSLLRIFAARAAAELERKRTADALREQSRIFEAFFSASISPLVFLDRDFNFVRVNEAYAKACQRDSSDFPGRNHFELYPSSDAKAIFERVVEAKEPFQAFARPFIFPDHPEWGTTYWDWTLLPLLDKTGEVEFLVFSLNDVTEHTRAEEALKVSEEHLRQSQKMEAIGLLAGGIAHDFNNLLMVMIGYSAALLRQLEDTSPLRRYPLEIKKAGNRAATLTHQLLAFSRRQVLEPEVLNLNDSVTSMSEMLQRLIGEHIELTTSLDLGLGCVKADQGQIEQVIMNLVVNARDAMPEGGALAVKTGNVEIDEARADALGDVPPGSYVMLAVSDTGHGMDEETQARIFEPFFTTKDRGRGTGLGLASVYGIVKQSGGAISVRSTPGHGTTFTVCLPRIAGVPVTAHEVEPASEPARGSETILLVENEEAVRTLVREALEEAGYRILEARHGAEALRLSTQHRGPIHLLLTDVVMPHINVRELADRLLRSHPQMKVLYLTGYTDDVILQQGRLNGGSAVINKPIPPETLVRKVRELLDSGKPRSE